MYDFAASIFSLIQRLLVIAACAIILYSCASVKNYPARKPFVYQTNIILTGKYTADEKKQLTDQLFQQLDDSIKARKIQNLIFWSRLNNPPVYDSINAEKSKIYMNALLNSLGYYRDTISYDTTFRKVDDQLRTTVNFRVTPGKLIRIDSVSYNLHDTVRKIYTDDTLQKITDRYKGQAFIKKGDPFSKPLISSEFDRLTDIYRNNGFLRFTRDELLAVWDTVGLSLLRPTVDPLEEAQLLEQLRQRRINPTSDLEIRLRPNADSLHLVQYYIGKVTIFPDYRIDTASYARHYESVGGYTFISYRNLFKPKKLYSFISLKPGSLYRQSDFLKTQNKFTSLGAWRTVIISQLPRAGQDTADFELRLTPARKYAATLNLEGSQNNGNILLSENLIGFGVTVGVQNHNFARAANQSSTNIRLNTEVNGSAGTSIFQTKQAFISHTIDFPRVVPRFHFLSPKVLQNTRTIFNMNAGITDRVDYYAITSFNTSWGYEYNYGNKLFAIRFPNIEYNLLKRRTSLNQLIDSNKSYKYIFNNGLILSTIMNLQIAHTGKRATNLANFSLETSGLLAGLIRSTFLDTNLYRFIKIDAEFRQTLKLNKSGRSVFAWRVFGGLGFSIPRSVLDTSHFYLPFFREYYAGGPNSMRAWGIRKLGPGSAIRSFEKTVAPDRFGDMRLEANAEYRFYIANFNGIILNGALFTDVGNVWFLKQNPDFIGGEFNINKLWKDIAIGTGTGLRIDLGFFKIRFDYAFKVKDPSPDETQAAHQNQWFYDWGLGKGQFQLGINYPF